MAFSAATWVIRTGCSTRHRFRLINILHLFVRAECSPDCVSCLTCVCREGLSSGNAHFLLTILGLSKLFFNHAVVCYVVLRPLSPSPSNLSHTLTGTHTHYQHISPHWHLPHSVQAGPGNPTAQKTYIKHFSFRKLQTCLSPSIRSENTRTSCLQPALTVSFTVQQTGC